MLQGKAQGTCDRMACPGTQAAVGESCVEAGKVPGVSERVAGRGEVTSCGAVRCTLALGEGE